MKRTIVMQIKKWYRSNIQRYLFGLVQLLHTFNLDGPLTFSHSVLGHHIPQAFCLYFAFPSLSTSVSLGLLLLFGGLWRIIKGT